jgi:Undecaprenyl-phosphate glucose phosphotransferase
MLKRHQEVFRTIIVLADLCFIASSWIAAYLVRFFTVFASPQGVPEALPYNQLLLLILPLWFFLFRQHGLYDARRSAKAWSEPIAIVRASVLGVAVLVGVSFFAYVNLSRSVVLIFFLLSTVSVSLCRLSIRALLRALRRRGYNLRYALVVGEGTPAEATIERFAARPETGVRIVGILDTTGHSGRIGGVPILGSFRDLSREISQRRVDQVIVALPAAEAHRCDEILEAIDQETVSVRLVPDLPQIFRLRSSVEDFDGLAMVALRESPFIGWAGVQKRLFDVGVAGLGLVLASPALAVIALAVWITSGRPILYRQERMGLDGRLFTMWKFRTMAPDAESQGGPRWASPGDPRRTPLGPLLRGTRLDELPHLWHVLRGDMRLVGPRPERPVFIEEFRREIPGYMLRHKVKAGVTGWAQVNGWRGDTCLHERVDHDIYYIENWSLGLDIRILALTLWRGMIHRNAY